MPIRIKPPTIRHGPQIETQSTLPEELGVSWRSSVESTIIGSLSRIEELKEAEEGVSQSPQSIARFGYLPGNYHGPTSALVSQEDAKARIRAEGMEGDLTIPEAGIRSKALDILIQRKTEEKQRNTIRQQSPGGAGRFAANLGVGFVGQLVDPLNVAAAFIPVVGEARYAAMLGRAGSMAGRTGVRVGVGAIEGTVGAAIVEPLNYYANVQQQADWDAFDSAQNIAGGMFFGSALHAGAGLFGDMIRPPRKYESTTHTDIVETKTPEVDAHEMALQRERTLVLDRLAEGRPLTRQDALARASENFDGGYIAKTGKGTFRIVDSEVNMGGLMPDGAWAREAIAYDASGNEVGRLQYTNDGTPPTVEVAKASQRQGVATAMYKVAKEKGGVLGDAQTGLEGGAYRTDEGQAFRQGADDAPVTLTRGDDATQALIEAEADRLLGDGQNTLSKSITDELRKDKFYNIRPFLAKLPKDTQDSMFRMAIAQMVTGRPIDVAPALYANFGDINSAADAAMRNAGEVAGADHISSQSADARIKNAPKEDLAALKEQAAELDAILKKQSEALGMNPKELKSLLDDTDAIADAKAEANALDIAVLCMQRAG